MWSDDELLEWKNAEFEAAQRAEAFEQNGGATKKNRRKYPSNLIPKKKKRKRK